MPDKNGPEQEWWTRFDQGSGIQRLGGFAGAIISTMKNWSDNTQTRLPGYQDRVAHISLDDRTEGGINLNMPPPLIRDLSERGRSAAEMLVRRFTRDDHVLSWDNHRWVRYRSLMRLLEQTLNTICYSIANPMPGERSYIELIRRSDGELPNSYQWRNNTQQTRADKATDELIRLIEAWRERAKAEADGLFGGEVPKPRPELRVRPRI